MSTIKGVLGFVFSFALAVVSISALAHEQNAAITTMLFNDRTGNIEISHRFLLHDAEHAVKHIFGKQADILHSMHTQQAFATYVESHFGLRDNTDKEIPLTLVGFELEGRFFWVYQEAAIPKGIQTFSLMQSALFTIWPRQVNTVNIEGRGVVKTLTFDRDTGWLSSSP